VPYKQSERSRRHNEAVRQRILAAARRLFGDRGYEATTLRAVASSAGTSTGNVYFHIGGKEALLLAVVEEFLGAVARAVDAVAQQAGDTVELLASLVYAGSREVQHRASDARIVMSTLNQPGVREAVQCAFVDRTEDVLAAVTKSTSDSDGMARRRALAWQGSLFWVIEEEVKARAEMPAASEDDLASFLLAWNLGALGIAEEEVDAALRVARRLYAAKRR
jgi:AcrR family transcriptional regulator